MTRSGFLIIIAVLSLLLAACGSSKEEEPTVSLYDLTRAMCAAEPDLPAMSSISTSEEKADELFTYFAEFDYEKVDAYYLSYAADGAPFEIGVIALKDAADAAACRDALKAHVDGRVSLYQSYAPDYVQQAKESEILTEGRYVALVMCRDRAAVGEAFKGFLNQK